MEIRTFKWQISLDAVMRIPVVPSSSIDTKILNPSYLDPVAHGGRRKSKKMTYPHVFGDAGDDRAVAGTLPDAGSPAKRDFSRFWVFTLLFWEIETSNFQESMFYHLVKSWKNDIWSRSPNFWVPNP